MLYCIALCGSEALAEDLASEAFLKAYLTLPNEIPSFNYWLCRICKNLWIDHLRRQKNLLGEDGLQNLTDHTTPETHCITNQRNQALWAAIAGLSAPDRELITLHYFSRLPLSEIARLMGKSHAAVRQRIHRLRLILKKRMEEQGYEF